MSTIKKNFVEIHSILESNQDKKVSEIMDLLEPLMESKQRDTNHEYRDGVLWVFCYYHKEWENTEEVEYGSKANTATGFNTMCKVGVNQWTKQQRDYKAGKAELLDKLASGELEPTNLSEELENLEMLKDNIMSRETFFHNQRQRELLAQQAEEEEQEEE